MDSIQTYGRVERQTTEFIHGSTHSIKCTTPATSSLRGRAFSHGVQSTVEFCQSEGSGSVTLCNEKELSIEIVPRAFDNVCTHDSEKKTMKRKQKKRRKKRYTSTTINTNLISSSVTTQKTRHAHVRAACCAHHRRTSCSVVHGINDAATSFKELCGRIALLVKALMV